MESILLFSLPKFSIEFIVTVWISLILIGIAGFFICRFNKWFIILFGILSIWLGVVLLNAKAYSELGKYSSERIEFTPVYALCFLAIGISAILPVAGAVLNVKAVRDKLNLP